MKILLVSATINEIKEVIEVLGLSSFTESFKNIIYKGHTIDILLTGVGIPKTVFSLTRWLEKEKNYDFCINLGICGAFDLLLPLGSVGVITDDRFGDLGLEAADESFVELHEEGVESYTFPFNEHGWLVSEYSKKSKLNLKKWKAVTVNKVTGSEKSIQKLKEKYNVDVETMEGAAIFFTCGHYNLPCLQLRAVSNHVEPRDKSKWKIKLAISNLKLAFESFMDSLK